MLRENALPRLRFRDDENVAARILSAVSKNFFKRTIRRPVDHQIVARTREPSGRFAIHAPLAEQYKRRVCQHRLSRRGERKHQPIFSDAKPIPGRGPRGFDKPSYRPPPRIAF